jgi:uncharacterized protein (DUF2267 family)
MAERGLEGIDHTVQQTYVWIDQVATAFHGDRHRGFAILRAFLHTLRDHLSVDESAQLAAQLPLLIRGVYYEGWDPSRSAQHQRTAEAFLERFTAESGVRAMDARDALIAAATVVSGHITGGEAQQVLMALPKHVRDLITAA